VNKKLIDY